MNETQGSKKEKNQHIQVFVRVRPINNAEESGRSTSVIEAPSNKEIVIYEKPQDKSSKKFTFDRVFGPTSKQIDVYNAVVSPLLEEVLAGYNCTVFAYGQTGTGKTFTMEGVSADTTLHWQSDTNAGMIPRFLSHLFDELRLLDAQEYTVRVSFLEIYNEELFDLLSASDDGSKIRLYEDASRKGGVIIHGLEEVTVHNKSEVYKILEKGSEKRRTAATLMNANSSRSHTVFSITVHIKENTVGGEDLLKTGKLNLVDLAGSESVGRSGAGDRRAREAANINQSLLTLGRVIIALVERAPHVPYRESKLTRLLQESLGGRTKTSIIATVSPASINLEETLSTLDYAHRAKNITNKPEINQKLSKKALLKEYAEEIERLRKDLAATRERNGVYIAHENYTEMEALIEQQGKEIEEKINHIKALEEAMLNKEKVLNEIHLEYMQQENNLQKAKCDLDAAKHTLKSTDHRLALLEHDGYKQKHLLEKHVAAEKQLYAQVTNLLATADTATDDAQKLHDKIIRMTQVEQRNAAASQRFKNTISGNLTVLGKNLSAYTKDLNVFCENIKKRVDREKKAHITNTATAIEAILVGLQGHHSSAVGNLETLVNTTYETYKDWSQKTVLEATKNADRKCDHLTKISTELASKICDISESIIVERLRQLNKDLQNKFACVTAYAEEIIRSTSEFRLNEHNELMKNIAEIRSNANEFRQNREKVLQKRRMFAKAMNELFIHFNTLTEHEEESHSLMKNGCNDMDNICDTFKNYVEGSWEKKVSTCSLLEETVQNNMEKIKNGIITFTEKNEKMSENMTSTVNILQDDLETAQVAIKDVAGHCRSLIESSGANLRNEIANNTTTILNTTEALNKTVDEVCATHKAFVNQQSTKILNFYSQINEKLDAQNVKSSAWNNKLAGGLQTMNQQLDKLFIDGMQRDIATGLTPAKRSFSYPREFAITSPHERILHRFREARKLVETSDEDDNIPSSNEFTIQAIANSTAMGDISTIRITPDANLSTLSDITIIANTINVEQQTSALTVNNLNKFSHSCDAIDSCVENSSVKKTPTNTTSMSNRDRVLSESELYIKNDNKENTSNSYSKYRKTRSVQSNKLKREKRQVLGTYN